MANAPPAPSTKARFGECLGSGLGEGRQIETRRGVETAMLVPERGDHRHRAAPLDDDMIAATAIVHRLALATRKVRDFRDLDVEALSPFRPLSEPR